MATVGIIMGSARLDLDGELEPRAVAVTRYGAASAVPRIGNVGAHRVVLLARHGEPHHIAPHLINYRANLSTLQELGCECLISLNTVGGITSTMMAGVLALPHDVVDYTWGRAHSYSDENRLLHVEFSEPFDARLRRALASAGGRAGVAIHDGGVYGCTQGPRFESPAEIDRMERDGCTLVGMTGMPEAALAAELELPYASLCLVVNPAAGRGEGAIDLAAITAVSEDGMVRIARLLDSLLRAPLSLA